MAKGYEANQERKLALAALGKDLARRAKSKCELSLTSGVPLTVYEIPPVPDDPDLERCLLVSDSVLAQLLKPSTLRPEEWRHLSEVIWSELPPVQVMALRILRHLAPSEPWAQGILEEVYLDPEIEAWADQSAL